MIDNSNNVQYYVYCNSTPVKFYQGSSQILCTLSRTLCTKLHNANGRVTPCSSQHPYPQQGVTCSGQGVKEVLICRYEP